uniref:Raftlin, lipid raft linker 1 n=1 Tax=Oryctolagus cuniculus TaxID=9986 RepID=A0A5F9DTY3_RABIT
MGCGLNKLEKRDEKRPGNIYSTLKRPQVETKIDVAYEYRFLEFTTLSAAALPQSSAVRLASLRDLPAQLLGLYEQGFSLAALHPFVQPTHGLERTPLEHIFRAILIKKTDRSQKSDVYNEGYILELDCCSSLDHLSDQKIIPEFIKKVQEAASQGLKFVGVIPQYHSSPSPAGGSPTVPTAPTAHSSAGAGDAKSARGTPTSLEQESPGAPVGKEQSLEPGGGPAEQLSPAEGVNQARDAPDDDLSEVPAEPAPGNSLHGLTEGVFIFEAVSTEDSKTGQGYDAIVVEQWTVLEGVEVQTDYVPLLNSLAAYGWQLTCVLPTPVIKTTREGSVSTKQIVFLQRPCLPQKIKKKESKFQWRFSRDEGHGRQLRRSKGRLGTKDKRQAGETDKTTEDPFSKAGDAANCVAGPRQDERAPEQMRVPGQEVEGGRLPAAGRPGTGEAVQNGPAGHSRASVGGCAGHPDAGAEVAAAGPETAEEH